MPRAARADAHWLPPLAGKIFSSAKNLVFPYTPRGSVRGLWTVLSRGVLPYLPRDDLGHRKLGSLERQAGSRTPVTVSDPDSVFGV